MFFLQIYAFWWSIAQLSTLTHRGLVTHICFSKLSIIGSDNGLSPGRRQCIIWTNVGILSMGPKGAIFSETLIEIPTFLFKIKHLKMLSGKWRPFFLDFNMLILPYGLRRFNIKSICHWSCSYRRFLIDAISLIMPNAADVALQIHMIFMQVIRPKCVTEFLNEWYFSRWIGYSWNPL